ncbi:MAG: hypothetical protein M1294_10695 [Firmicutes bacterium]|nr:hypothetical protein [Bacillota bacterium]
MAYQYLDIDLEAVWSEVRKDLPPPKEAIRTDHAPASRHVAGKRTIMPTHSRARRLLLDGRTGGVSHTGKRDEGLTETQGGTLSCVPMLLMIWKRPKRKSHPQDVTSR